MTLDEAKALAEQGNVDAMMALASYYKTENNDEEASRYYELAAERGDLRAIHRVSQSASNMAHFSMKLIEEGGKHPGGSGGLENDLKKSLYWATKLANGSKTIDDPSGNLVETTNEIMLEELSRLSGLYYLQKNFDELARVTKDIDAPYARAVHGYALFMLSKDYSGYKAAFDLLKNIENSLCWKEDYQNAVLTRALLIDMVDTLTALYRTLDEDVDAAYHVLEIALANLTDESDRDDVRKIMTTHYRKKLLGGYTYVE